MIKTVILDFDGVILDSNNIKEKAFSKLYSNYGKNIRSKVSSYHKKNLGVSRYKKIKYFHESLLKKKISKKEINNLANKFSELVYEKIIRVKFIQGAYEFISKNYNNYDLHISSATPKSELVKICKKRKIKKFFKTINGSPNTKKQHIKFIKKKYHVSSNEIIYLGDSYSDFKAAKESNVYFIKIGFKKKYSYKKIFFAKNLKKLDFKISKIS